MGTHRRVLEALCRATQAAGSAVASGTWRDGRRVEMGCGPRPRRVSGEIDCRLRARGLPSGLRCLRSPALDLHLEADPVAPRARHDPHVLQARLAEQLADGVPGE